MELPAPFTGWRYDEESVTVHTVSGYRCTPEQIESALWLTGILRHETAGRRIMYADTPLIEPRPRVYHWRDFDTAVHISADRRRRGTGPCRKNPVAAKTLPPFLRERHR